MRAGHSTTNGLTFGGFYGVGNIEWWISFDWYIVEQRPKEGAYGRTLVHYDFTVRTDKYSPNAGIAARPIDLWFNGRSVAYLDFGYQPGVHKDQTLYVADEWINNSADGTFVVAAAVNASFYYWNSNNMTMNYSIRVDGDGAIDLSPSNILGEQDKQNSTDREVLLSFKTDKLCSKVQYKIDGGAWKNADNGDVRPNGAGKTYLTRISGLDPNRKYNITLWGKRDYNDKESYWSGVIYTKPSGEIVLDVNTALTTNNTAAFDLDIQGDYSRASYRVTCDGATQTGGSRSTTLQFRNIAAGKKISAEATATIYGVDNYFTVELEREMVNSQTAYNKPTFKVGVQSQIDKIAVLLSDIVAPQGYKEEVLITPADDSASLGTYDKATRTFSGLTQGKSYIITCRLYKDKIPTSDYEMSHTINVTVVCGQDTIESLQIVSVFSGVDEFRLVVSYSKPTTKELTIDMVAIGGGGRVEKLGLALAPKVSATGTLVTVYQSSKIVANKDYIIQLSSGLLKSALFRTKTAPLQVKVKDFFAEKKVKPKYVEFRRADIETGDQYLDTVYYNLKYRLSTETNWTTAATNGALPIRIDGLQPEKTYIFEISANNGFNYTGLPGTPQPMQTQTITLKLPADTFLYVINDKISQKYKVYLITENGTKEITKPMFQVIGG